MNPCTSTPQPAKIALTSSSSCGTSTTVQKQTLLSQRPTTRARATHDVLVAGTLQISSVTVTPILRIEANVTCAGASNVSELMEYVKLSFKIEGTWFEMNMTFNSQTRLYSALIPAYSQLANKTIQYYVTAKTKEGSILASSIYTHRVPEWVMADLNRDGKVNLFDIVLACRQYGKP